MSSPVSLSPGFVGIFKDGLLLPDWFYNLILSKYKLNNQAMPWKLLFGLLLIMYTNNYGNNKANSYDLMSIYHETDILSA